VGEDAEHIAENIEIEAARLRPTALEAPPGAG
jgi:hypothetical protein